MVSRIVTSLTVATATAFTCSALCAGAEPDALKQIEIPYKRFVLPNGLTLIVHEDHKAPIVACNIWYHVGSKNERPGHTGFAHLFEHLMFNGSENFNDDFFQAMERVGATDMNGTTSEDRTNYFEDVPTNALELALWMESDRMGHFAGAITQARLDEQRGVVQNEKRQGENQPYGGAEELIVRSTYPANHPYSWSVIGSMEDLNAASLEDVKGWFKNYYGSANAVLVLAGDITADSAREKVLKYFGDIPSGPPVNHQQEWVAKRHGTQRQIMQDRVPQARLYKVWNVPSFRSEAADYLDLAGDLLGSGKSSRLYQRLVYKDQIASSVQVALDAREIGSQFDIVVTARPGQDLSRIEAAVNEELARFITEGPSPKELERVKTEQLSKFLQGIERIGGFGGKSDILAVNQVFAGDPDHYKVSLRRAQSVTARQLQDTAREWLSDGDFNLEVHPFPSLSVAKSDVDRSKLPVTGTPPDARFPQLETATLDNGLRLILAERHGIPVLTLNLALDAGFASDSSARPGTAKLAMNMLDEGTDKRSSLEISEQLGLLGASLYTGSDLDTSTVGMTALKAHLDSSLEIFGDVVLNPNFPEKDFQRLKKQQLDAIEAEKVDPHQMALRVLPKLLYGTGNAYALPLTGSGNSESVQALTRDDVKKFHGTWFFPNHATLVIVGDTTMEEIKPKMQRLFAKWKPGEIPRKNIKHVELAARPSLYLIDRPGSLQSLIAVGEVTVPKDNPMEVAIQTMNNILGGQFTSRINMNLREDKHWSYGAHTRVYGARGQRPFVISAPVQTDKTKESMAEISKELQGILKEKPITAEELAKVKKQETLELAGKWETSRSVASSIAELVRYGLPLDYYNSLSGRIRALDLATVADAATAVVHPNGFVWVIIGDREKIETGIRELGFGPLEIIDADGNPVK
jgi:zinc protease